MAAETLATPEVREKSGIDTSDGFEGRVILFNCECHSYEDVIELLCKSVPGMTPSRAFELAWTIDHRGQAEVYAGTLDMCHTIAALLAEGGLRVQVQ